MDIKRSLQALHEHLGELEGAARTLPNKNFADLIKRARGCLLQASEHADAERVGEALGRAGEAERGPRLPFPDGGADCGDAGLK